VNNQWFSKVAVWLVIALVLFTVFKQFDRGDDAGNQIGYSDFLEEVRAGASSRSRCRKAPSGGTEIIATTSDDRACAAPPPTSTAAWSAT
jgi:cell division protease FtsH